MTRTSKIGSRIARVAAVCALAAPLILFGAAPASAASNRLANGAKLSAGSCLVDGSGARQAKFCVGRHYDINLYYGGRICWTWQASGHLTGNSSFVKVATNGDVEFYQYSGGRRIWHSGTTSYSRASLVVGSHMYGKAILAVDTGSSFFTFKSCH
jgi:hypothetical protein